MSTRALEADIRVEVGDRRSSFTVDAELALETGLLILFGPSGAGKSLVLQALGGLVTPSSGRIVVAGETLFDADAKIDVPAHKRHLGYVPQHHSLFPFCDVMANVLFGLPRAQRNRKDPRILALLEELGIDHLARARPESLSGGERQRVALARALAVRPRLLLLDEPFAAIDFDGRQALRDTLRRTLAQHQTPAVFITHEPREARALGDRLVLFERGHTLRTGTPEEILGSRTSGMREGAS